MAAEIRIGCASWNVPLRFASDAPSDGSHLERYALVFDCMEINSTFRRQHKAETWARWREAVPASFRFAVKMPSAATHGGVLDPAPLPAFFGEIAALQQKLGPVLMQFPPKLLFGAGTAPAFFCRARELFDGELVCEPRHPSWFSDEAEDLMRKYRIARVAADPERVAGAARPGGWDGLRYYRLHGAPRTYYSEYTADFVRHLAAELRQSKVTTWCIFDNTASGAAFGNARDLQRVVR